MLQKTQSRKWKDTSQKGRKNVQVISLIRDLIQDTYRTKRETTQLKLGRGYKYFSNKDIQMTNKPRIILSIITHQGNANQNHKAHFKPTRMTICQKDKCGKIRNLRVWVRIKFNVNIEKAWHFLKVFKVELPRDPIIPLLGIQPREIKTHPHKDFIQTFIRSSIPNNQEEGGNEMLINWHIIN